MTRHLNRFRSWLGSIKDTFLTFRSQSGAGDLDATGESTVENEEDHRRIAAKETSSELVSSVSKEAPSQPIDIKSSSSEKRPAAPTAIPPGPITSKEAKFTDAEYVVPGAESQKTTSGAQTVLPKQEPPAVPPPAVAERRIAERRVQVSQEVSASNLQPEVPVGAKEQLSPGTESQRTINPPKPQTGLSKKEPVALQPRLGVEARPPQPLELPETKRQPESVVEKLAHKPQPPPAQKPKPPQVVLDLQTTPQRPITRPTSETSQVLAQVPEKSSNAGKQQQQDNATSKSRVGPTVKPIKSEGETKRNAEKPAAVAVVEESKAAEGVEPQAANGSVSAIRSARGRYAPGASTDQTAQRLARLLISEIKLYNKFDENSAANNVYDLLKDPIDKARKYYGQRLGATVIESMPDYFHDELVRSLCAGDPSRLGPNYQGSK